MLSLALVVLAQVSGLQGQAAAAAAAPVLEIAVGGPVYAGLPVWIRAVSGPVGGVRYPFNPAPEYIGCNRLEVERDGVALPPRRLNPRGLSLNGLMCGSAAPQGSPPRRLPLHVLYPMDVAGTYRVRWTIQAPVPPGAKPDGESEWLTFKVLASTAEQREAALTRLVATRPESDGLLAGDFLPALAAFGLDARALDAYVDCLYAENAMVSGLAASFLERFPEVEVRRAVVAALVQRGPSRELAYFASYHTGWTREDEQRVVRAAIPYLVELKATVPAGQTPSAAALTLLRFVFQVENHAWPADDALKAFAEAEEVKAAPRIMAEGSPQTVQELAENLGMMESNARAHALLVEIAKRTGIAGEQARICLTWHPRPEDLAALATALLAPGGDPYGYDRGSLPYALVKAYGDAALPYLEKAVAESPYRFVRTESAQQLALKGRAAGFRFLLDAIETNQPYRAEMVGWVRRNFWGSDLPNDATEAQIAEFLRRRAGR